MRWRSGRSQRCRPSRVEGRGRVAGGSTLLSAAAIRPGDASRVAERKIAFRCIINTELPSAASSTQTCNSSHLGTKLVNTGRRVKRERGVRSSFSFQQQKQQQRSDCERGNEERGCCFLLLLFEMRPRYTVDRTLIERFKTRRGGREFPENFESLILK